MPQEFIVSLDADGYPYYISKCTRADNATAHYVVDGDTDRETLNGLIMECVNWGMVHEAIDVMKMMGVENVSPKAFNNLIMACAKANRVDVMMELLGMMWTYNITPDSDTFNSLIVACALAQPVRQVDYALELFAMMGDYNITPYPDTFNALILSCATTRRLNEAMKVFETLGDKMFLTKHVTMNLLAAAGYPVRMDIVSTVRAHEKARDEYQKDCDEYQKTKEAEAAKEAETAVKEAAKAAGADYAPPASDDDSLSPPTG
jgi:pentatricopeptide repeat protein